MRRPLSKFTVFLISMYLILPISYHVAAQGENNNWAFGFHAGLNFGTGSPLVFTDSINADFGCAAVSDKGGNLLFYTNGLKVWNKNHQLMPHGNGIVNGFTLNFLSENTVIVPFIEDTNKYYVFTIPRYDDDNTSATYNLNDTLYYSVVDTRLSNGLGDVIPGQKSIPVDHGFTTTMTVVPGLQCNVWLITHARDTNVFKTFKITAAGISLPVTSTAGINHSYGAYRVGDMKSSPIGDRLALTNIGIYMAINPAENVYSSAELFDFNNITGIVSNCQPIEIDTIFNGDNFFGVCFSPDGSKLYTTQLLPGVAQFDLAQPSLAAITASKTLLSNSSAGFHGDMAIGPDNKIYVSGFIFPNNMLDRIDNPNIPGIGCNYVINAVQYSNGPHVMSTLPQKIVFPIADTLHFVHDTVLCKKQQIVLQAPPRYYYYEWQNQSSDTAMLINTPGIYWVRYQNRCHVISDTFSVESTNLALSLGGDTSLCEGQALVLNATNQGASYLWNDGSTQSTLSVSDAGLYAVTVSLKGCQVTDSIEVSYNSYPVIDLGPDTVLCTNESFKLKLPAYNQAFYTWQDGSHTNDYLVDHSGIYYLLADNNGCQSTDSLIVIASDCSCPVWMPSAFSPNGDGKNDYFHPAIQCKVVQYQIRIFDRWGQCVFVGTDADKGWDGTLNGLELETGTYYYIVSLTDNHRRLQELKGDITLVR